MKLALTKRFRRRTCLALTLAQIDRELLFRVLENVPHAQMLTIFWQFLAVRRLLNCSHIKESVRGNLKAFFSTEVASFELQLF